MNKHLQKLKWLLLSLFALFFLGGNPEELKADWAIIKVDGESDFYYCDENKNINYEYIGAIEGYNNGEIAYVRNGKVDKSYTGIANYNGKKFYIVNGLSWEGYTGLVPNNDIATPEGADNYSGDSISYWYVIDGVVAEDFTGYGYFGKFDFCAPDWLGEDFNIEDVNPSKTYYINKGVWDRNFSGVIKRTNVHGWTYFAMKNGVQDFSFSGFHPDAPGVLFKNGLASSGVNGLDCIVTSDYYYFIDGILYEHTGLVYDKETAKWVYLENGRWNYHHPTTLIKYNGSWWYVYAGVVDKNYTGLFKYNGTWWYIKNGQIDWKYKGLVKYNGSWWYVENGQINWKHSGLVKYNGSWWYVKGGQLRFGYTGLAKNNAGWFHVINGKVKFGYTGLSQYTNGWWYMKNGTIQFSYTGLVQHSGTWYYVSGGKLNWNAAGLCKYAGSWWYVRGGILRFDYTGLAKNSAGWFHVIDGKVKFGYTGMTKNENGWWYMRNGKIDFSYTGLGTNESGTWYYKNGRIQFGYSGRAYVGNVPYRIDFGQAKRIYIPNNYLTKENTEYRIMEIAYRTGDYSKLSEYEMQFAKGLFNCLDAAYCYTSDWEREKAVYDYLCRYVKYDYDTYAAHLGYAGVEANWESYNAVGAFRDGLAVCDGYAKAFQYAMSMLGIPCERVVGSSRDSGEGHAWNRVQIGGKWYQVDVTWADHLDKDGSGNIYYTYFNITDEQMLENHVYRITDSTNKCTSTEHSYKAYLLKYEKDKYCKTEAEVLAYIEKKLSESKGNITIECYAAGNVYFNGKYFNFSSLMNNHKLQNVYGVKDVKVDKYVRNGREIITFKFTLKRN